KNEKHIFPFIINEHKEFILHPTLNSSNKVSYINNQDLLKVLELKNGNFEFNADDKKKWVIFKYYKEWNWIIGYSLMNQSKYKELYDFRNDFLTITFSILFIIAILITTLINYFVTPIVELTKITKKISEGSLDAKINVKGSLELVQLSKSFRIMRDNLVDDISKLKKVESKIKHLNITLEQKVTSRTAELAESNEELEQTITNLKMTQSKLIEAEKMACIGGLVAGVAHEINTPVGIGLTGITHFLEITTALNKKYSANNMSQDEFEEYLSVSKDLGQQIHLNLERTAHLIRSFKQVAVDQTSEEKRVFRIKEYFEEVIFSLHNIIKKTNITIKVSSSESFSIRSYPGAYSQIITNLIINSFRHAYKDKEKGLININIAKDDSKITIVYSDDGKGIKKEHLNHIFDPFFTTSRDKGGTGLGLNIIYNIITSKLNGTIHCTSQIGVGVEFSIILPIEE
ncbi:MAG: HAMP domain-containing protein, partial [Campylobacteraceae bacterium]|nr:HAMP domain-containing protein [Campylobacteraceae bacterium]